MLEDNPTPNEYFLDIREAYKLSWEKLENAYLTGKFKEKDKTSPQYNVNWYEETLIDCIRPVISSFVRDVAFYGKGIYSIGRAILHINSLAAKKRIRIPINGGIVQFVEYKSNWYIAPENSESNKPDINIQGNWENLFFKDKNSAGDRSLMYLQPDKPNHLLTELMWRMQSSKKVDAEIYAFVAYPEGSPSEHFCLKQILELNQSKHFKSIELSKKVLDSEKIGEVEVSLLNSTRSENPKVKIKDLYNQIDCELLLKNPIKILKGDKFGYPPPKNIFYVSDVNDSDYLGSLDFELLIDEKKCFEMNTQELNHELINFIYNLRWLLSKYVIELLANTERNFATSGELYNDVYFDANNGYKGLTDFISQFDFIIEKFERIYPKDSVIINLYKKINNHFRLAKSEIGLYWRGYKRHAYEVACCVAGIIDILFSTEDKTIELEKTIRATGPRLEDLNSEIDKIDMPYLFKQLFRGLEREKELFLLPFYRDHFIHSFYCFGFGLILLGVKPQNIINGELILDANQDKSLLLLRNWFIVAMWHDIAYVLQKGNGIIEKYVLNFMKESKRFRNILPWTPRLGNLMQIHGLLDEFRHLSENSFSLNINRLINDLSKTVTESDIVIGIAFDKIDHGIWSSLLVHHGIKNENDSVFLSTIDIQIIAKAIMTHHIASWGIRDILKDYKNIDETKINSINEFEIAKIEIERNPLGYLLGVCDMMCQAGREAPEIANDTASSIKIKYKEINLIKDNSSIEVRLLYGNSNSDSKDVLTDFYDKPAKFLNLDPQSGVDNGCLSITIEVGKSNKSESSCFKLKM